MIHRLSVKAYLWVVRKFERVEKNETTLEHAAIELSHEWDHAIHLAAPLVHGVTTIVTTGLALALAVVTDAFAMVGYAGSILYLGQLALQARLYGVRRWLDYGIGTGVPVHPPEREAESN